MEYVLSENYYLSLICVLHNYQNNSYEALELETPSKETKA